MKEYEKRQNKLFNDICEVIEDCELNDLSIMEVISTVLSRYLECCVGCEDCGKEFHSIITKHIDEKTNASNLEIGCDGREKFLKLAKRNEKLIN